MSEKLAGLAALLVAALAGAWYFMKGQNQAPASDTSALPVDPAGRRSRARSAIMASDTSPIPPDWLYYQAQVETGDFNSASYFGSNSLFNRHVGSGAGDWTGRVYMNGSEYPNDAEALKDDPRNALEHLRIYDSPEQSVRDVVALYHDPLYAAALAAAKGGDRAAFFAAVAYGNGKVGYVGPSSAQKATDYVAALNATAARAVVS